MAKFTSNPKSLSTLFPVCIESLSLYSQIILPLTDSENEYVNRIPDFQLEVKAVSANLFASSDFCKV